MDYTEMLFAAHVRELAYQLRVDESRDVLAAMQEKDQAENDAIFNRWLDENTIAKYVPQALTIIRDTAVLIKSLE